MSAVKTWSTPQKSEKTICIPCSLCGSLDFKNALFCEGFNYVKCKKCGLVQINPQPLPSEVIARYNKGDDYLSYELANENAFLQLQLLALKDAGFKKIEKKIKESNNSPSIIDIGCATGALLAELEKSGWDCLGVEISKEQAEYAKNNRNLKILDAPLGSCSLDGSSFDMVHASHLIEHLNNPDEFIAQVHHVLKPGGRFFITTPNIAGFQALVFGSNWRSAIFDHLYLFSRKTLSLILKKHGFKIEKISTWGGLAAGTAPAPLKRLFDKAVKYCGLGDVMIIRALKI